MAYLLTNLLQGALIELGQLNISTVTSGTTIALVDTKQTGQHSDDDWKNGSLFVIRAGTTVATAGQYSLCTGYTDSTGSFTTTWTTAPAAADTYGYASDYFPLFQMIELANQALASLGKIALVDVSLTTAANQTEYELPVACKGSRPLSVSIQGQTGDANDNRYVPVYGWEYIPAAPGTAGNLVFDSQPISGRTIKIVYSGVHPDLTIYTSTISETIAPELAMWALVNRALKWQNSRSGGEEPGLIQQLNDARSEFEAAKVQFPIWAPKRRPKLLVLGGFGEDLDSISAPDPGART